MPEHDQNGKGSNSVAQWPKRMLFGATGAAVAGFPLLSGACPGSCTSCLRCAAGASGLLVLLIVGNVGRRARGVRRSRKPAGDLIP